MAGLILLGVVFGCVIQSFVDANFPIDVRCGSSSNYRWLNLVQPQGISNCGYTIRPFGVYVCQLKVEFTTFLPEPVDQADLGLAPLCPRDNSIFIGKFTICGTNTNQHVYLDFDGSDLTNTAFISASVTSGTYSIKVTQIICPLGVRRGQDQIGDRQSQFARLVTPQLFDKYLVAPAGCDQYFIPLTGIVESFGFNYGRGKYPGDFTYTVCFKTLPTSNTLRLIGLEFDLEGDLKSQLDGDCTNPSFVFYDNIRLPAPGKLIDTQRQAEIFCGSVLKGRTVETNILVAAMFTFNAGSMRGETDNPKRVFRLRYEVK